MGTLLVGYDLNRPGQKYEELIRHLRSHGTWWHYLDSTWLIATNKTATQLRDEIKRLVDPSDEVLVINVSGDAWASLGLDDAANSWLKTNM